MTPDERLRIARANLAQAQAWPARTDDDRKRKAANIAAIRATIARLEHPTNSDGGAA